MTATVEIRRRPATSGKVNRANKSRSHAAVTGYHSFAALVEAHPDAHATDVYSGRDCIGSVVELERQHHAFDHDGAGLGVYRDRIAASRTVMDRDARRLSRVFAS